MSVVRGAENKNRPGMLPEYLWWFVKPVQGASKVRSKDPDPEESSRKNRSKITQSSTTKRDIESQAILRQNRSMATLSLTDEQVVELAKQLAPQSKQRVLADLTAERDQWWQTAARDGEKDMRRLAEARGLDWDAMTEARREAFVDEILHES